VKQTKEHETIKNEERKSTFNFEFELYC